MQKKNNIIVSIIIPAYNEEKYLGKCLTSLKNQSFYAYEILVINDGSIDHTAKIASDYNVKVFTISHSGSGYARNFGARKAQGKVLIFVDADMYFEKNYIKNLIAPILLGSYIGTNSKAEYVGNIDNIWAKCWNTSHNIYDDKRIVFSQQNDHPVFRAILADKFLENGGFDIKFGYYDDHSLAKKGLKVHYVGDAISYHNNPSTLYDVFLSARWIGRSKKFKLTLKNFLRYSILNSLRISINETTRGAPFLFIVFKIIFDLGILSGMLFKNSKYNYAK